MTEQQKKQENVYSITMDGISRKKEQQVLYINCIKTGIQIYGLEFMLFKKRGRGKEREYKMEKEGSI